MHDYSRDIMLATAQEQIEMKIALSAAETKANALNGQLRYTINGLDNKYWMDNVY